MIEQVFLLATRYWLAHVEEDIDDRVDNAGALILDTRIVSLPLGNNQEVHESEETKEKKDLRHHFMHQVKLLSKVNGIGSLEDYSKSHVCHTKNDTHLHLETIVKIDVAVGIHPDWIYSHGIHTIGI